MNQYLIPANSKKGMLIFGVFNFTDLIIFSVGLTVTFLLLMIFPPDGLLFAVLELLPVLIAGTLVAPIPNYHNTLTVLITIFEFATINQRLEWRGWEHVRVYGEKKKKK